MDTNIELEDDTSKLSVLNPDGLSFDDHITDRAELKILLGRIAAATNTYGIDKVECSLLDEDDRVDVHLVCVKPGAERSLVQSETNEAPRESATVQRRKQLRFNVCEVIDAGAEFHIAAKDDYDFWFSFRALDDDDWKEVTLTVAFEHDDVLAELEDCIKKLRHPRR